MKNQINRKTKFNIKKKSYKIYYKIKNLILDLHNKACKFICSQYKTILIPILNTKDIVQKIFSKSVRQSILALSHYKFILRLKHCASKNGNRVVIVREDYTSKTCGNCGELNHNLKNKDIFHCNHCNLKIERDPTGSRNILLKALC